MSSFSPARRYVGWPDDAKELVESACARHGSWERFESVRSITLQVLELGGPLLTLEGLGRSFIAPRTIRVEPHAQRTTYVDWPVPGGRGTFDRGNVRIERPDRPELISRAHREAVPLLGFRPEDALYFFGYALLNYLSLPFLLAATRLVSQRGTRITVEFPPELHTHSRLQAFAFDGSGLLVRHDYTADVIGPWATGSHFSSEYAEAGGMRFAQKRWVRARLGSWPTPIPVLHARLGGFAID